MYVFNFIIFVLFSVCFTQASYSAESEKDYLVGKRIINPIFSE